MAGRVGPDAARDRCRLALRLAVLGLLALSCALGPRSSQREAETQYAGLDRIDPNQPQDAGFATLERLARIFYDRIANRRFNSKATYDDPALREYFHSLSSFSDYYANVVDALERAHFEDARPTAARLLSIERTAPGRAVLRVLLIGENGQPLRWWTTRTLRADRWEYVDGRWWVIPGKV